jgi:aminoglycoside phosphotransferase (APT) family kinase protein
MSHQRRLTFDLDLEQVRPIVRDLDPSLRPTDVSRLAGGSTEVYRIGLAGNAPPLVLKLYADEPAWAPAKEALVAGWIGAAAPIPIPRWLAVDETRSRLQLRYAVTTWLPGQAMRSLMAQPGAASAYREMGRLLRCLHSIPMSAYGYLVGDGVHNPKASNAAYMEGALEQAFRQFRTRSGEAELARRLEAAARKRAQLFDACVGPVFCHDDFQQGNVLAERLDGEALRLSGLIDFGNARAGDFIMDLAKSIFCMAHEDPASVAPLMEGYGRIDHPDADGALWLYTLFHRVTMWNWLTGLGDNPAGLLSDLAAMCA